MKTTPSSTKTAMSVWNKAAGLLLASSLLLVATASAAESQSKDARPNFIFYITDDVSAEDIACYGHPTIKTPHIDKLAEDGMRFTNMILSISSCSPSRCSIITGRWPHNTGAPELHTPLPTTQLIFPQLLRKAGYYTVLSGKNHMGNVNRGFHKISRGKGPGLQGDWVSILRNRPKDKPFFCWFASFDAHRPWETTKDAPTYALKDVVVPPYMVDGPATRRDLAAYYHEISRIDTFLGRVRKELEAQGIADNTYIVFTSDNGRPFPRCKTRLYDSGVVPPFIVSGPGVPAGSLSKSLVSSIDLAGTFLELAGLSVDARIQGLSMVPILKDPKATIRDFTFSEHNWHVYQNHHRSVRYGDYLYIHNAWPNRRALSVESAAKYPAGKELWQAHAAGKTNAMQRDIFLNPRPSEELYKISSDPNQLQNVAGDPQHATMLQQLRGTLDRWVSETGDTVPKKPTLDREPKRKGWKHREMPGDATKAWNINAKGPVRQPVSLP